MQMENLGSEMKKISKRVVFTASFSKNDNHGDLLLTLLKTHYFMTYLLTCKASNKNCSRRHFNFLLLSLEENKF